MTSLHQKGLFVKTWRKGQGQLEHSNAWVSLPSWGPHLSWEWWGAHSSILPAPLWEYFKWTLLLLWSLCLYLSFVMVSLVLESSVTTQCSLPGWLPKPLSLLHSQGIPLPPKHLDTLDHEGMQMRDVPKTSLVPPVPRFPAGIFKLYLPISQTLSLLHCPQVPSLPGPLSPGFPAFIGQDSFCRLSLLISYHRAWWGQDEFSSFEAGKGKEKANLDQLEYFYFP